MKTYYQLAVDYHPQTAWAAAPMWLEMSFGALGGGLFIVSALLNYLPGIVAGYLLVMAGKGLFLLADLGKQSRFLYVLKRPFHSWISFGAWAILAFALFGLIFGVQVLTGSLNGFASLMKVLALAAAAILIVYDGFFLAASRGVAAWRSSVLPVLFGVSSLATSVSVALALNLPLSTFLAAGLFVLLALAHFSYIKGLMGADQASRYSADELVSGSLKTAYLWVAVVTGTLLPLAISVVALLGGASTGLWLVSAVCAVVGVFALRYSILRGGYYAPVL